VLPARLRCRPMSLALASVAIALLALAAGAAVHTHPATADRPSRAVLFTPRNGYIERALSGAGIEIASAGAQGSAGLTGWITEDIVRRKMPIPRKTERISDARLDRGMSRVVREGSDGVMEQMILVRRGESGVLSETIMREWVSVTAEPKVIAVGTREPLRVLMTSRGSYTYRKSYNMIATGYEPSERSCGKYADGYTANGIKAAPGIVAVDPKVIPLRTKLYVEGYGPALAADVGGAIKGNRIDLFFNTVEEALRYGRRRVKVYVLEDR